MLISLLSSHSLVYIAGIAVNPTTKVEALQGLLNLSRMKRLLSTLREKEVKKPQFNTLKSKDDKRYFFGALTPCEGGARVQSWRDEIIETVESILRPMHEAVLVKMPTHTVMSVSVLVSLPGAIEQQLHTDFNLDSFRDELSPTYPFSVIIPLHDSCELIIKDDDACVTMHVPYPYYIQFRGDVIHAGGVNRGVGVQYRMHAYFSSPSYPIPFDTFYEV